VQLSSKNTNFIPLLGVLKQMQFWLESASPPQIMLAAPAIEEFNGQKLPSHCKVTRRKIYGTRVPVRGRSRHLKEFGLSLAHWPEDALTEGMQSMLVVVINGQPEIRVADYSVHCRPGDFLLVPAHLPKFSGKRHPHHKVTAGTHYDLALFFHGTLSLSSLGMRICHYHNEEDSPSGHGEACWLKSHFLGQMFTGLEEYLQKNNERKCAPRLLAGFVALFQEEIESGHAFDALEFPSDSPLTRYQDPIEHAQEYIQNHLDRPLSIDVVARWVGLSRSVFTRSFRTATNQSFTDYLTEQRLEQAKVLLADTDLSVVRIGEKISLSPRRLQRLFQEKYRCTPREFRLSQRKTQKDGN
jgi:AraC-like DNA-binding protein